MVFEILTKHLSLTNVRYHGNVGVRLPVEMADSNRYLVIVNPHQSGAIPVPALGRSAYL